MGQFLWIKVAISSTGKSHHSANLVTHVLRVAACLDAEKLDSQLRVIWELESLSISGNESPVYEQFGNDIFKNGRYEVLLPWNDAHSTIPDNYQLCLRRLEGLLRRLRPSPETQEEYNSIIQDQVRSGIMQVIGNLEHVDGERVHYLPHHAIIRHDKETTKMRIVYDASAKSIVGPKFNQKILDILLRFRIHQTELTADTEKAF